MDDAMLEKTYPEKYYFKTICKCMYYLGMGQCWYEDSLSKQRFYKTWFLFINTYILLVAFDEMLSHFRTDLNDKERTDLMQFSLAHPLVITKIYIFYYKKDQIAKLLERLLEGTRSIFYSIDLERILVKQLSRYYIALAFTTYLTLIAASVDAIIAHIREGVLIRTEVFYYPTSSDTGILVNVIRFLIQFHWYYLMAMMLTIDFLVLCSMVAVRYKFMIIKLFYEEMRRNITKNPKMKTKRELEEEFIRDYLVAIKLHEDALCCARDVQFSMGGIYSIQVSESVALLVVCLFKLVASKHNLFYLLSYLGYSSCLVLLTGAYMMTAGDITYEASLVPTSIFHCGWERLSPRSDFRVLVVVSLLRSQAPVEMTAFGIITLSYTNFISVLRSSYSFFAVMY